MVSAHFFVMKKVILPKDVKNRSQEAEKRKKKEEKNKVPIR